MQIIIIHPDTEQRSTFFTQIFVVVEIEPTTYATVLKHELCVYWAVVSADDSVLAT